MNSRSTLFLLLLLFSSIGLNAQIDSVLSKVEFEMDFRFRAEQDWNSQKSDGSLRDNRSRLRYRMRTGVKYKKDWYTLGFRLRTGDPNKQQDPQLTLGKGLKEFGTLPIGFEKIYFKADWKMFNLWVGKNTYPFDKNNELFWSDNVYPEGVSLEKQFAIKSGILEKITLKGGHFILASNDKAIFDDAYFQAFQSSFISRNERIIVFPSIYIFRNIPNIPDGAHSYLLDYTILHVGTRLNPIKGKPWMIDFDYYQNIEDYDQHNNVPTDLKGQKGGYTIGAQYGNLKKKKDWMFKLTYAYLERYSILDFMAQNDWARWDYSSNNSPDGRLSNFKGAEIVAGYCTSKKSNLIVKYYIVEQLIPYGTSKETGQRVRFDFNIKF